MHDPRLTKLADVLVNYSIGVKPGQLVSLTGPDIGSPLILELARAVLKAGGNPITRITLEAMQEMMLKHGNEDQLKFVNPVLLYEFEKIDAFIALWGSSNTRALSNCDPSRQKLLQGARRPMMELSMKREAEGTLKWVGTQYPTQASAQDAEMSLNEYADFVFTAGLLDQPDPVAAWRKVGEAQQRLCDYLNGKKDYRVVASNGTDVRMSIAGMKWVNCKGESNFPDGEVFSGPVLDSVNGQINFSFPAVYLGREVQDVKLTFKNGKVIDASAGKGQEFLFNMLDMDGGSRFIGECAIGTNYSIRQFTRNTLFDEKIGGTVHFALGAGYPETGNSNKSGLHWDMVVDLRAGGYVEVDGVKVSVDGKFTREGFPTQGKLE